LSSSQNPFEDTPSGPSPEILLPPRKPPVEDPPFRGLDVVLIVAVTIASIIILPTIIIAIIKFFYFKNLPLLKVAQIPEVVLTAQFFMYVVVFIAMYKILKTRAGSFWPAIRWNWPSGSWAGFLLGGALVYFALAGLGALLPIPKHLPIDRFFKNAREATIMSVFAVTLAPLMEELFFRGFLYPVLARRFGMGVSIFLTGAAFGILHGAQLKYSWAVLIIFLVGVVLTAVRAKTKSVAASFLVHVGYNGTLSILLFVATGGFQHLDKLNQ
jgi:hypothetical protein